ncbi:MAG: diaminopimelate decarboxylase [Polyangiaceae bacterium UTPRO1]|jgi:diaminopimelate decarboxylase|nr:diaminopimelate decarboxylase [Myxococcales bacterium]OQY69135.1 MAG: diaminopimelate decarboxylase [Polyangiaceae bacterium UTPRO1]
MFDYRADELHCEDVPLTRIAAEVGTPAYVYSLAALRSAYRAYDRALAAVPHIVCYAIKANDTLAVIRAFAREGSGFDIVSGGELARALRAGADPKRIVFAGVGKQAAEMEAALRAGILMFNVESPAELEALAALAERLGTRAPIAIRVNPDVDPKTHPYISTGMKKSKFGVAIDAALELYARAAALPGLEVVGVDCHIGSQLTSIAPFLDAWARIRALVGDLRARGHRIRYVDLGGGLGITYRDETPPTYAAYGDAIADAVRGLDVTVLVEPGRSLVGNAGVLLAKVVYNKAGAAKRFVIVDAAMNDLIRPSLYEAYHDIRPVKRATKDGVHPVDVVGPICESGDFLAQDRPLPPVAAGDLLAVMSAGAYGFVMASNYNARPRPASVLVDGARFDVVRARETIADLMRGETVPTSLG